MSTTCCPEFVPIKVSQLVRYQNIDPTDFLLVIESGSANYSRRSTIGDLFKSARFLTSSYSGSFSGSYWGKIISKNANITGALSGSYFGSVFSKNTVASGSFSGSYWGRISSKNIKATGSLSGNFYGIASGSLLGSLVSKNTKASGSFSGSTYGNLISKNAKLSGSFSGSTYGNLTSKNTNATGSFSGSFYGTIKISQTSSYLNQTSVDDSYKFTYFDGNKLVHDPSFRKLTNDISYNNYYLSSSIPAQYFVIDSKASGNFAQSGIIFSNNYNRKNRVPSYDWGPEGWRIFANKSGSLNFSSLTGSYQFTNENFTAKGVNPYFSALETVNNVFYFWPEPYSYSTITRDASIAIGKTPPISGSKWEQPTKARLHISVFSSSVANKGKGAWTGNGTVRQLDGAIYVEYGSGSLNSPLQRTFYVSGSGNMYTAGNLYVGNGITGNLTSQNSKITGSFRGIDNITNFKGTGKKVSFNGTSSYSITSSYCITASYVIPSAGANTINRRTVDYEAGGYGTTPTGPIPHGCPSTPFAFTLNWVAKAGASGFSDGDVIAFTDVVYFASAGDNEIQAPGAAISVDSTNVTIGWPSYNWRYEWYLIGPVSSIVLRGSSKFTFSANYWYLRITYFY